MAIDRRGRRSLLARPTIDSMMCNAAASTHSSSHASPTTTTSSCDRLDITFMASSVCATTYIDRCQTPSSRLGSALPARAKSSTRTVPPRRCTRSAVTAQVYATAIDNNQHRAATEVLCCDQTPPTAIGVALVTTRATRHLNLSLSALNVVCVVSHNFDSVCSLC